MQDRHRASARQHLIERAAGGAGVEDQQLYTQFSRTRNHFRGNLKAFVTAAADDQHLRTAGKSFIQVVKLEDVALPAPPPSRRPISEDYDVLSILSAA